MQSVNVDKSECSSISEVVANYYYYNTSVMIKVELLNNLKFPHIATFITLDVLFVNFFMQLGNRQNAY